MSAPRTNTEKQARRHWPALIGIAVAAILGGLFFLLNVDDAVDTDDPPIEETDIDTTAPEAVDGDGTPAGEDG